MHLCLDTEQAVAAKLHQAVVAKLLQAAVAKSPAILAASQACWTRLRLVAQPARLAAQLQFAASQHLYAVHQHLFAASQRQFVATHAVTLAASQASLTRSRLAALLARLAAFLAAAAKLHQAADATKLTSVVQMPQKDKTAARVSLALAVFVLHNRNGRSRNYCGALRECLFSRSCVVPVSPFIVWIDQFHKRNSQQ